MQEGLGNYASFAGKNIDEAIDSETSRFIATIFFLVYFILVIGLTILGYYFRKESLVMVLALLIFLTIPGIVVYDGYIARFFFFYGDVCTSVHKAMNETELPVADKAIGYYVNCLKNDTRKNLFIVRYQLEKINKTIDASSVISLLEDLKKCKEVVKVIPKIEKNMCKESIDWLLTMVKLFVWLIVALVALGVAIGRVEVVVWRKKKEIESMLDIMEAVY